MEHLLPLRIIAIPGKGKGVVTLKDIPNNTLICWYIGDVQSIDDTDAEKCDSLVDIGEVDSTWLVINPQKRSNVGRYLNASPHPNVAATQVLRKRMNDTRIDFCMFLYSIKAIPLGSELEWNYGGNYKWKE